MERYPAFDPPEYVQWEPDPTLQAAFRERLDSDPVRQEIVSSLSTEQLLEIYRDLLRTRLVDIGLKRWVRQGVISKAWLGTGEEAVTVGSVYALDRARDMVYPMIRNAGACHMMGMPLAQIFHGYLGTTESPNAGRDLHIGDLSRGVIQPVSQMGTNAAVTAGVALGFKTRGEDRVALTWVGDGATRTGIFHEGANLAAVEGVPAVFVLQDNQVALGTERARHSRTSMTTLPGAYGVPFESCDGNHVLDVFAATVLATRPCREGGGPAMVVAETFRMGGHATHDEREGRSTFPEELFREWGRRDPVGMYEEYLVEEGISRATLGEVEASVKSGVEAAAKEAYEARFRLPPAEAAHFEGITDGGPLLSLELRPVRWGAENGGAENHRS